MKPGTQHMQSATSIITHMRTSSVTYVAESNQDPVVKFGFGATCCVVSKPRCARQHQPGRPALRRCVSHQMRGRESEAFRADRTPLKAKHLCNRLAIELLYNWTNGRIWLALLLFWCVLIEIRLLSATNDSFQIVLKVYPCFAVSVSLRLSTRTPHSGESPHTYAHYRPLLCAAASRLTIAGCSPLFDVRPLWRQRRQADDTARWPRICIRS